MHSRQSICSVGHFLASLLLLSMHAATASAQLPELAARGSGDVESVPFHDGGDFELFLRSNSGDIPSILQASHCSDPGDGYSLSCDSSLCDHACDGCRMTGCDGGYGHCGCSCHSCNCPLPQAACIECPRVSTLSPYFNINVFGAVKLDMLFNEARPFAPGTPFFLAPGSIAGFDENTFDLHARQTTLGAALVGPQFGGFQSGGLVLATFYNDAVIVDQYGFLPLQGYGELKNEDWRFAAGLLFDVFSPGAPTVLPFSILGASGNAGNAFRGQVRVERYIRPSADRQWTVQLALSEPVATGIDNAFRLLEDNGWPNVEGRLALGCGCVSGVGAQARRPFEWGVSGVVGQLRTTVPAVEQVVADVWGVGTDLYWRINDRFGIAGELFTGAGLGTYNAGILQTLDPDTFEAIQSTGGWLETFVYWTPCLHTHLGYGIDDPDDDDVGVTGRTKNETYFANLLWDINSTFRIGFEFTYRETDYFSPTLLDNEGAGFHTQFQWAF